MPDLETVTHLVRDGSPGAFVLAVLVLVFGPAAILSEKTAEKLGLFGVAARWFRDAKQRAIERDRTLSEVQVKLLREEIAEVDRVSRDRIEKLSEDIARLTQVEALQHEYIVWATRLMRNLELWASEEGLELPPPPFLTFTQWAEQHSPQ